MIRYRVHFYESESGWGSDEWTTDYLTEDEAKEAYQKCWDRHMNKASTPSYYIRPTYVGKVEVNNSEHKS